MSAHAALQARQIVTVEEYLELERAAEYKSEYLDGEIVAMAGSNPEHSIVTLNISSEIGTQLKGKPCRAMSSDMKVHLGPGRLFAYPDLTVVCGEPRYFDSRRDVLLNPTVVFEVLSPTTEASDRGRKAVRYREIESLQEYVLISQVEPLVERYTRQPDGLWLLSSAESLGGVIHLPSIECALRLEEVYDGVILSPH